MNDCVLGLEFVYFDLDLLLILIWNVFIRDFFNVILGIKDQYTSFGFNNSW